MQQGNGQDNSMDMLWIMALVFGVLALVWYLKHDAISALIMQLRVWQIRLAGPFGGELAPVRDWLLRTPPATVHFEELNVVSELVGHVWRWPVALLLGGLGASLMFMHPAQNLRRRFSMQTLVESTVGDWPQIAIVKDLELVKIDIETGPWAMCKRPVDFALHHKLLRPDRTLLTEQAERVFAAQMGPLFDGVTRMRAHERALCALFILRVLGDRDGAMRLTEQFAVSAAAGKLDLTGVDTILTEQGGKAPIADLLRTLTNQHAYVRTFLASLLIRARQDGVLASADFLWLKPLDRVLWYTLNNVGRRVAWTECAGVYAHWQVELEAVKARVVKPIVVGAVQALDEALKEVKFDMPVTGAQP